MANAENITHKEIVLDRDPTVNEEIGIDLHYDDAARQTANPRLITHRGWIELSRAKKGDVVLLTRSEAGYIIDAKVYPRPRE